MRMARRGALAQQLNAIESLASVDAICIDKTGTLTDAHIRVESTRSRRRRRRGRARACARPLRGELADRGTPRSPRSPSMQPAPCRGAARDRAVLVAPPLERARARRDDVRARRAGALPARRACRRSRTSEARSGRRVVAFGIARRQRRRRRRRPRSRSCSASSSSASGCASDARETVAFLRAQGVRIAVLSGDRPETVAAVAADAGIDVGEPVDGSDLPPRRGVAAAARRRARGDRPHRAGGQEARRRGAHAPTAATSQ